MKDLAIVAAHRGGENDGDDLPLSPAIFQSYLLGEGPFAEKGGSFRRSHTDFKQAVCAVPHLFV